MKTSRSAESISPTFCILPWIHLSTRPNGHMRVCCTANASSAGATNDKEFGGEVGILKTDDGKPANLNSSDLISAWNNSYMKDIRRKCSCDIPASCTKCFKEEAGPPLQKKLGDGILGSTHRRRSFVRKHVQRRLRAAEIILRGLRLGRNAISNASRVRPTTVALGVRLNKLIRASKTRASKRSCVGTTKAGSTMPLTIGIATTHSFGNNFRTDSEHAQLYAGGESTIIKEYYELLRECIRRGEAHHIELRYNSNGMELPDELLNYGSRLSACVFTLADSIGEMNHYIRYPTPWEHIKTIALYGRHRR